MKEKDGFFANFVSGAVITNPNTGSQCTLSIKMELKCDSQVTWNDDPQNPNSPGEGPVPEKYTSITDKSCEINVVVPYNGACENKPGPEPGPDDTGLSAGSL